MTFTMGIYKLMHVICDLGICANLATRAYSKVVVYVLKQKSICRFDLIRSSG